MSGEKNKNKTGKTHRTGEKYGAKVRTKCLTLLKTGLSVREVSEKTGVARSTINAWKKSLTDDARARLDSLGTEKQREFVNRAWSDIELAQRAGSKKIGIYYEYVDEIGKFLQLIRENGTLTEEEIKAACEVMAKFSDIRLSDLGKWIDVNATQARLLEGKPTANVNVSGIGFEDL